MRRVVKPDFSGPAGMRAGDHENENVLFGEITLGK
jgi:hypothetical protein